MNEDMKQMTQLPEVRALTGRRGFMAGVAGLGLIQSKDVFAMLKEDKVQDTVSEHARPKVLPPEAHDLPRWIPRKSGGFNLANPADNHVAFAKTQANIGGHYDWLANYGWVLMAPPGQPAYPLVGRIVLVQTFLTPADKSFTPDPHPLDYVMWGSFVTLHVDPRTLEPVDRVLNPYTGKMMDMEPQLFADRLVMRYGRSLLVPGVDPKFYDQPWDRDGGYSQHFFDAGDTISYTVLGSAQLPGPQQPRCDVACWNVKRDELMNPALQTIDCWRDYSAIMKASEYKYTGVPLGDEAQLFVHMTGVRTSNVARLPSFMKTSILDRFADRFRF